MALRRIDKEIRELKKDPLQDCNAEPIGKDMLKWKGVIKGPKDSLYEGGVFKLDIELPSEYPYKPPHVKFLTKIYHPNVDNASGAICLDILKDKWSPALTISKVLLSISSLMADPNQNDPLDPITAAVYKANKQRFENTARQWTQQYAKND